MRVPRQVLGDVRSQVAACFTGERGYLKLMAQHGAERFSACTTMLLDQAERLAQSAIAKMPDARTSSPTGSTTTASTPIPSRSWSRSR